MTAHEWSMCVFVFYMQDHAPLRRVGLALACRATLPCHSETLPGCDMQLHADNPHYMSDVTVADKMLTNYPGSQEWKSTLRSCFPLQQSTKTESFFLLPSETHFSHFLMHWTWRRLIRATFIRAPSQFDGLMTKEFSGTWQPGPGHRFSLCHLNES